MLLTKIILIHTCFGFVYRQIPYINRRISKYDKTHTISQGFIRAGGSLKYSPSKIIEEVVRESGNKFGSEWSFSDFANNLNKHQIESATLLKNTNSLIVIDTNHQDNIMYENIHAIQGIPETFSRMVNQLADNNINFDIYSPPVNPLSLIPAPFQFILVYFFIVTIINLIRQNSYGNLNLPGSGGMNNPLSVIMPNKELSDTSGIEVNFSDVAGCDEAKFELEEIVDFLKNPELYENAGAKIPKGVLLEGEPGTGKTLLAQAVAGEAGVNFISASGSEFIEMFVGVGASRVRNLFNKAKDNSPCVIFIDEIDAIGRQRGAGFNSGNDEREQTLNQILTNMDGFDKTTGIIVLAATNRADILDSALTRPGRFDRKVKVPLPNLQGRVKISEVHFKNKNIANDVDLQTIASLTGGFSGADIANLANEAAIYSVRTNNTQIRQQNIIDAYEKITIGIPSIEDNRKYDEQELVAYHEAGHTLIALLFKEFFKVQRVTINSNKGGAGGYTLFTPLEKYQNFPTKKFLLANMILALGGRAAEIVLYQNKNSSKCLSYNENLLFPSFSNLDITTGASGDLKQANDIARKYVSQFGLADNVAIYDSSSSSKPFLGRDMAMGGVEKISEDTKAIIDEEINKIVDFSFKTALEVIKKNYQSLCNISDLLILDKTISYNDLQSFNITYYL